MSCMIMVFVLLLLIQLACSENNIQGEISTLNGNLTLDEDAELEKNGLLRLTNSTNLRIGHAFHNTPLQFKNSTNGSVFSFSTTFIFAILYDQPSHTTPGQGMAFVITPSKQIPGALSAQHLGLFNGTNNGDSSNHRIAIELDTVKTPDFEDIDNNHVGIDINGLKSIQSAPARYFTDTKGNFKNLSLASGDPMQVWVEYDEMEKQLNVTISPTNIPKPPLPLLSLTQDLSPYIFELMYVGFSASTGSVASASHYILGWSFKMNGQAQEIDMSRLPKIPRAQGKGDQRKKTIVVVVLSLTGGVILLLVLIFGAILISRKRKFTEVIEDWEVQYGPHGFTYKDLFIATKGFKDKELLGRGGFGRVYPGMLHKSSIKIAVKRITHDSRQGMREFVAEIATIGRLRHPNLVRLLGYCRRKQELFLVYDYMPNGSLDQFLYGQTSSTLNWTQRFKIIKDVALALFYLHEQWMQVVIHGDVKASNVLLDDEMNGRLGDFGLAKLCDHGTDPQTSHVAGTLGYIAPELSRTGKASTGTDLFAFGAFMLEVVCGRKPIETRASPEEIVLVDWVMEFWDKGAILETVDERLGNEYIVEEVELVLKLGLLCSHPLAAARPSMSTVVQFLSAKSQLPDNLNAIIKARGFHESSNGLNLRAPVDAQNERSSIPLLPFSQSFSSEGR